MGGLCQVDAGAAAAGDTRALRSHRTSFHEMQAAQAQSVYELHHELAVDSEEVAVAIAMSHSIAPQDMDTHDPETKVERKDTTFVSASVRQANETADETLERKRMNAQMHRNARDTQSDELAAERKRRDAEGQRNARARSDEAAAERKR